MKDYLMLPDRLKEVAKFIPQCNTLTDIGTDHSYIPIYSVKNNLATSAIAADVALGPLKIAQENIANYNLSEKVTTVLSDGLINVPQSDVYVIAGMGGTLISEILQKSIEKAKNAKLLILQPMTCSYELRIDLHKMGFCITEESLAKDSGKLYNIIIAKKGEQKFETEVEYQLGKYNIENNHPLMKEFLEYKIRVLNARINNMKNSDNPQTLKEAKGYQKLVESYKKVGEKIGISL